MKQVPKYKESHWQLNMETHNNNEKIHSSPGQCRAHPTFSYITLSHPLCLTHQNPCSVILVDYRGTQPIHDAASSGHLMCLKFLLSKGSKIQAVDAEGRNILHKVMKKICSLQAVNSFPKEQAFMGIIEETHYIITGKTGPGAAFMRDLITGSSDN